MVDPFYALRLTGKSLFSVKLELIEHIYTLRPSVGLVSETGMFL